MTHEEREVELKKHKRLIGNKYIQINSGEEVEIRDVRLELKIDGENEVIGHKFMCLFDTKYNTLEELDLVLQGHLYQKV